MRDSVGIWYTRGQHADACLWTTAGALQSYLTGNSACRCRRLGSSSGASSSKRQLQSTVLGSYKAELREFRALQQELEPWVEAFKEQHARKPMLADVHATREAPTSHHACA